jgi:broad specificity phosphatase PhoE
VVPPQGESLDQVATRVWPVVAGHVGDGVGGNFAIVAHGMVNRVILTLLRPDLLPTLGRALRTSDAGMWELEISGSTCRILRRDDTRHLRDLLR